MNNHFLAFAYVQNRAPSARAELQVVEEVDRNNEGQDPGDAEETTRILS